MVARIRLLVVFRLWIFCRSALAQETTTTADSLIDELILDLDDDLPVEENERNRHHIPAVPKEDENQVPTAEEDALPVVDESSENEETPIAESAEGIKVKSNLESMSIADLDSICRERGFVLEGDDLQHADYVEAAKRCLSLEDEMNAILAENPDLAAELESEIERMAREKDRLEKERDTLLAEKEELEAQLKASGMDVPIYSGESSATMSSEADSLPYDPTSSIEVFRHSFRLLWGRVGADIRLVGKALRIVVLHPGFQGLRLVWRYTGPTVESGLKKAIIMSEGVRGMEAMQGAKDALSKQIRLVAGLVKTHALPLLAIARSRIVDIAILLNRHDPVRKVTAVVGAVLGPVCEGLVEGWRSIKPDLINAQTNITAWLRHLESESHQ